MNFAILHTDHPLCNTPLSEIGAEYRNIHTQRWNRVMPRFGIAKASYNDLRGTWIENNEWRVPFRELHLSIDARAS